jgi:hypothetical protein
MSLSQADLQVIQTVFGKTAEELSGALSSDQEVSLDLRLDGRVISQEDEAKLKTTAIDAGVEIGYKNLAKAAGVELAAGEKDAKIIADKLKSGITSTLEEKYKNMTPGEELTAAQNKITELEQKYNTLHGTYETTKGDLDASKEQYVGLQQEIKTKEHNNTILKSLPEKAKINKEHAVLIINNSLEREEIDGNIIYKRDGKTLVDPVGTPLTIDKIVPSLAEEFGWVKGSGMNGDDRGNKNNGLPKGMTDDAAMAYMNEKGIDTMSPEGSEMFSQLTRQE